MFAALGGFEGSNGALPVIGRGGLGGAFGLGLVVGSLVIGVSDAATAATALAALGGVVDAAGTIGAAPAVALAAVAPLGAPAAASPGGADVLAALEAAHAAPPRATAKRPTSATTTFALPRGASAGWPPPGVNELARTSVTPGLASVAIRVSARSLRGLPDPDIATV